MNKRHDRRCNFCRNRSLPAAIDCREFTPCLHRMRLNANVVTLRR